MRRKAMDKALAKHIKETKRKDKQDKQGRKATIIMIMKEQSIKKKLIRQQQATFIVTWSSVIIKKT